MDAVRPKAGVLAEPDALQRVEGAEQRCPGGCSHPPGLALKGGEQAPTLLQRGLMQILSHLAHLGEEFTLLDIHKPLCAISDVGCSLLSVTLPRASVSCCHCEASQPGVVTPFIPFAPPGGLERQSRACTQLGCVAVSW